MSDLELLFLILALLYLWECLCWLPRGGAAFTTWLGRRWRPATPSAWLGNQHGGFALAAPLPPLGRLVHAAQSPVSISPDGVLVFVSTNVNPGWRPPQSGRFVSFAEIREVRVRNKKILVNGGLLVRCAYPNAARELAGAIERLAKMPMDKRAEAIGQMIRASFDIAAARKRWEGCRQVSRWLRGLVNVLFVYLFIAAPVVIYVVGFKLTWLWLLLGLLVLTITLATLFYRAHRALYPAEEDDRFTHMLTTALSPATAARAHDTLSRPLLQTFHPLVPARLFLDEQAFREYAGRILRDVRYPALPVCSNDDPAARAAELHWRTVFLASLETFLKKNGANPDDLTRPPKPADGSCRAYCPRCLAQFTSASGTCSDCGGLALVTFDNAK